jgi:hypothetical protein
LLKDLLVDDEVTFDGISVTVTGQMVVETGIIDVTMTVESAGQFVTSGAQLIVTVDVEYMVLVVQIELEGVSVLDSVDAELLFERISQVEVADDDEAESEGLLEEELFQDPLDVGFSNELTELVAVVVELSADENPVTDHMLVEVGAVGAMRDEVLL